MPLVVQFRSRSLSLSLSGSESDSLSVSESGSGSESVSGSGSGSLSLSLSVSGSGAGSDSLSLSVSGSGSGSDSLSLSVSGSHHVTSIAANVANAATASGVQSCIAFTSSNNIELISAPIRLSCIFGPHGPNAANEVIPPRFPYQRRIFPARYSRTDLSATILASSSFTRP